MSCHITFIYMYLYLIWEQFLFFRTKLIVQAYDEVGHRVQVLAVCSGLTHLVRGSLRGFSPAGHWPQSEERLCTSSGQSDRSVKLHQFVLDLLVRDWALCTLHSAPRQVSQTGQ